MKVDSVLSLGSHCEPAFQIERFFKTKANSPFDWLISTNDSFLKILKTDGELFGLRIKYAMNGTSIYCEEYGCYYHHEFERDKEGLMIITPSSLKDCREKLLYKYNQMIEFARKSKPLFIRYIHPAESASIQGQPLYTLEKINEIFNILSEKIGHSNFELAFITIEKNNNYLIDVSAVEKFPVHLFIYDGEFEKNLVDEYWDNFFKSFGFEKRIESAS